MDPRSVLFTPGDRPEMLERALETAADAVVFDLEDGVSTDRRPTARGNVVAALEVVADESPPVRVRINPLDDGGRQDLDALEEADAADLDGIVVPKVADAAMVYHHLGAVRDRGLPRRLWCLLETPAGVLAAPDIAAVASVDGVIFGGEDYAASVGADRTAEGTELLVPRQQVVMAAGAADVAAIDGITSAIEDADRVEADAGQARAFGFDGKLAIHPAQVDPIHAGFAPDDDQLQWARQVLTSAAKGDAGAVRVADEMIDAPLLERARRILRRAGEDPPA